jgi:hypothetical protein
MTTKKLVEIAKSFGLNIAYISGNYIGIDGVNGQRSTFYSDGDPNPSTMIDFYNHIYQMGRDSLKMDLDNLLHMKNRN